MVFPSGYQNYNIKSKEFMFFTSVENTSIARVPCFPNNSLQVLNITTKYEMHILCVENYFFIRPYIDMILNSKVL
jgi:hypothetical protein